MKKFSMVFTVISKIYSKNGLHVKRMGCWNFDPPHVGDLTYIVFRTQEYSI